MGRLPLTVAQGLQATRNLFTGSQRLGKKNKNNQPQTQTPELIDSIRLSSFASDDDRYATRQAALRLLARISNPWEQLYSLTFEQPTLLSALKICQDLGLWARWAEVDRSDPGSPKTLSELVAMCNPEYRETLEPNLLRRVLRHAAAMLVIEEEAQVVDSWRPTPLSLALGSDHGPDYGHQVLKSAFEHCIPVGANLPGFLCRSGYREPRDNSDQFDNHRDAMAGDNFFTYCQKNPEAGGSFIGLMAAIRNYKMDWTAVYDTSSRLIAGADLTSSRAAPLLVDVGGAHGLDASRFVSRNSEALVATPSPSSSQENSSSSSSSNPPLVVLQDLPEVVTTHATETLDPRIVRMPHDFFTPQPVIGARAYFMHAVPHDWPDQDCLRIFGEIRKAMRKGYSKLLIYEIVLPARGALPMQTSLDLEMMTVLSALERTEDHWRRLLAEAGFKVTTIERHDRASESVIEAVRDDDDEGGDE